MATAEQLLAVGPLDGRYADKVQPLGEIVSEFGLIKYRVAVEAGWLAALTSGIIPRLPDVEPVRGLAQDDLSALTDNFSIEDALAVKKIERTTNHDVKAVELWMRDRLQNHPVWRDYLELIHFGMTSEDANNLSFAMMLKDARDKVIVPNLASITEAFDEKATTHANVPMLARTHGQPATPTTLGKEMAVFAKRLDSSKDRLGRVAMLGKFNGASGNYNAVTVAYPDVEWPWVSQKFVESLGFIFNHTTTQIEPHDWMSVYFNELALSNTILTDAAQDIWQYISYGYFKLRVVEGETGSSTMPHKVNPIDFENAWANLGLANCILNHLAGKLPISKLQRDLSDSSAQRAIGEAFGHTTVAHASIKRGMGKIEADTAAIAEDLKDEWPVLTEAVQTVMRRYRVPDAYNIIKSATRGKPLTEEGYKDLVSSLDIPEKARQNLLKLTPQTYIGRAAHIARTAMN